MPYANEILNELLAFEESLGPEDAYNENRRTRLQTFLNKAIAHIQMEREWPWRQASATVQVTAPNGYGSLPTTFSSFGKQGGVYHPGTFEPLSYVEPQILREMRRRQAGATTDEHRVYSWFDQDTSDPYAPRLQVLANTSTVSFPIDFLKRPVEVYEDTNDDETRQIPEQFHRTALIPYMIYLIRDARGDASAPGWMGQYEQGLKGMQREVLPPGGSQSQQMPDFFGEM